MITRVKSSPHGSHTQTRRRQGTAVPGDLEMKKIVTTEELAKMVAESISKMSELDKAKLRVVMRKRKPTLYQRVN